MTALLSFNCSAMRWAPATATAPLIQRRQRGYQRCSVNSNTQFSAIPVEEFFFGLVLAHYSAALGGEEAVERLRQGLKGKKEMKIGSWRTPCIL
jgi:hypothetical protein